MSSIEALDPSGLFKVGKAEAAAMFFFVDTQRVSGDRLVLKRKAKAAGTIMIDLDYDDADYHNSMVAVPTIPSSPLPPVL